MNRLKTSHRSINNLFQIALFLLLSSLGAWSQTNQWLKPASGYWEEQYWSLGTMPSQDHDIVFNTPGDKVLAITQQTAKQHPQSLTVNTLEVGAPDTSRNMLVLDDLGLNPSFVVNDWFTLSSNAALYCMHSSLKIGTAASGGFVVGGQVFQGEGAQVDVHALWLGYRGEAAYYLSNGLFSVGALHLGGN